MTIVIPDIAISIRQPWAWAIVTPGINKNIENRDWPTKFRGPVAIHASLGMTRYEYEGFISTIHHISERHSFPTGVYVPDIKELPRGGIVGVAEITDCVTYSDSPWFAGKYGFVLANAEPVDLIPVKGRLGFFNWRERL